jgi:hypothetical protein
MRQAGRVHPEETPSPDPALPWAAQVIVRTEVGSTAHGTGLPGGEDYDEMGVVLERWESAVGLSEDSDNIVYRPGRAITERSNPGDYDLVLYTPRKFARLAASGNPSVLMLLFGPLRFSTALGDQLRALAPAFWSERARGRFLGYSRAQRERLLGIRGGAHTNRPELIEQFGFDTKYAMHMLRLGIQGVEYTTTGRLTLPIPEPHGSLLRSVRRGEYTRAEVLAMADENEAQLESLTSAAPPEPDVGAINAWLLDCHRTVLPID